MGDEQDAWFKPFGFDPGQIAQEKLQAAQTMVSGLVHEGQAAVEKLETDAVQQVTAVVKKAEGVVEGGIKKVISVVPGAPAANGSGGGGGSVSSLGGSVGAGGANNPNDVKAVQAALGIAADGKCGGGTISAIKAFQQSIGQANPDGRVDPGGSTARALAGGGGGGAGGGAAPANAAAEAGAPAAAAADSGDLFDNLVQGAKDLGASALQKLEGADAGAAAAGGSKEDGSDILGGLKSLGGTIVNGVAGLGSSIVGDAKAVLDGGAPDLGGSVLNDAGGGASPSFSSVVESVLGGGQFTILSPDLLKLPPDPGFPIGTVAFGQFAAKLTGKFKPKLLSAAKAPKPEEAELGIKAICKEIYENASFSFFGKVAVKGDTKSAGVAASFLKVSTKVGDVTLEIKGFEIGLDLKKIVKASIGSTSANFPVFERLLKDVPFEIFLSIGGALEVSPNPAAGVDAITSGGILLAIDVALVVGPPLAAGAIIGIGIFAAGEKGALEREILAGAIDARQAAFDYASTMTGSVGNGPGPRAKAVVAVAKAELAKVASSQKVSLDQLMQELRDDKNNKADFVRIHAQARQQIFGAYFGEVRKAIKAFRKEHNVIAIFTTAEDDIISAEKLVGVEFEKS